MSTLPVQDSSPDEVSGKPRRNIFEDPAIVEAGKNDPFARFIAKNWRFLLVCLCAVGLGMVGYNRWMTTATQKRADATKILREVQEGYRQLVEKQSTLLTLQNEERLAGDEKARASVAEKVKRQSEDVNALRNKLGLMLAGLESPPPFNTLASLYRGLLAAQVGDFDATNAALSESSWESVGSPQSPERAAAELVALGLANALADSDKYRDVAKSTLIQLAEKGDVVAVRAIGSLAVLAASPEDKERVRTLIAAAQQRFPAQQKLLSTASERVAG